MEWETKSANNAIQENSSLLKAKQVAVNVTRENTRMRKARANARTASAGHMLTKRGL